MQTSAEIVQRWRYLRGLLLEQLDRLLDGSMTVRTDSVDTTPAAIVRLRREIEEFDALLIAEADETSTTI